ncbi:MAG: glucose-1-phosphate thymidylyltransferase RfbA [Bdellovibrionales bacterium]|nr:glucose-1-phosphate thymidylyltransferase RfbA [Bdellovibrionales bacterium]
MKGIILAGGSGTRLYPMTQIISKQLLPIYDKPMIYYPLSLLMLGGIKEVLIISTERDTPFIKTLLGDGTDIGMKLSYKVQTHPNGLAEAFILGDEFIGKDDVTMILGDNLFYGDISFFRDAVVAHQKRTHGFNARVFGYYVEDARRYGVVEFEKQTGKVFSIEEKPLEPRSNYAVPGLYIFDSRCVERAKNQKPSKRGEIEIVDLIKTYLADNELGVTVIGRGVNWLDTGTPDSLLDASQLISTVQKRQGLMIGSIHEIAYRMNYLDSAQFGTLIAKTPKGPYRHYLERIVQESTD